MPFPRQFAVSFCMGLHCRLGDESQIQLLCPELIKRIVSRVCITMYLKRANELSLGKYYNTSIVPNRDWLSRFLVQLPDTNFFEGNYKVNRKLWMHKTRFFNMNHRRSWKYNFMLYETDYFTFEEAVAYICTVVGSLNFQRYFHVRTVHGSIQIFIFGPEVDSYSILKNNMFIEYSYFSKSDESRKTMMMYSKLQNWPSGKGCIEQDNIRIEF